MAAHLHVLIRKCLRIDFLCLYHCSLLVATFPADNVELNAPWQWNNSSKTCEGTTHNHHESGLQQPELQYFSTNTSNIPFLSRDVFTLFFHPTARRQSNTFDFPHQQQQNQIQDVSWQKSRATSDTTASFEPAHQKQHYP
jgi:hypothetical protein